MTTTTENKTVKNNMLIAEFMDVDINSNGTFELPQYGTIRPNGNFKTEFEDYQLKYNSSWDWLMPVVEKIFKTSSFNPLFGDLKDALISANKNTVYDLVVEFIKWHNSKN